MSNMSCHGIQDLEAEGRAHCHSFGHQRFWQTASKTGSQVSFWHGPGRSRLSELAIVHCNVLVHCKYGDKGAFLHKHAANSIDSRLQGQFRQIASLAGILMSFSLTSLRSTSKV